MIDLEDLKDFSAKQTNGDSNHGGARCDTRTRAADGTFAACETVFRDSVGTFAACETVFRDSVGTFARRDTRTRAAGIVFLTRITTNYQVQKNYMRNYMVITFEKKQALWRFDSAGGYTINIIV